MALDKMLYRHVMSRFTTGVAVLTTNGQAGPLGMTINAFCSVSIDPPLVLVCVDRRSHTLPSLRTSGSFIINILTEQQEYLSRSFAAPSKERYEHFCFVSYWKASSGAPVIDDVLAFIDARIVNEYPGGDHMIFLGQVEALGVSNRMVFVEGLDAYDTDSTIAHKYGSEKEDIATPLVFYGGQYHHLCREHHDANGRERGYIVKVR